MADFKTCDSINKSQYARSSMIMHESQSDDALRDDILYGVDPLNVEILDRSIARSFPITAWNITITTDNPRLEWPGNTLKFKRLIDPETEVIRYDIHQDYQAAFDKLTSGVFRYGNYEVSMCADAGVEYVEGLV